MGSGWGDLDPMRLGSLLSFVTHPERAEDAPEPCGSGIPQAPTQKYPGTGRRGHCTHVFNKYSMRGFDPTKVGVQLKESLLVREENILKCGCQQSRSRVQLWESHPCQVVRKREFNPGNYLHRCLKRLNKNRGQ